LSEGIIFLVFLFVIAFYEGVYNMGNVNSRKNSFTLMEMLVRLAIATIAIGGMFAARMSYMEIWQSTSDSQLKE
jgi:hypothetical protein